MKLQQFFFKNRGFLPLPFVAIALIWAKFDIENVIIGATLSIIGESIRIYALRFAGGATRTRKVGAGYLVMDGPYKYTRNPLYIGNMLIYIGIATASDSFFPLLPLFALIYFWFQYKMIIELEEHSLKSNFGELYHNYSKLVPRLIPKKLPKIELNDSRYSTLEVLKFERSSVIAIVLIWIFLVLQYLDYV